MLNEEQIIFWLFLGIFGLFSILKTHRRYLQNRLKEPPDDETRPPRNETKVTNINESSRNQIIYFRANRSSASVESSTSDEGEAERQHRVEFSLGPNLPTSISQAPLKSSNSLGVYTIYNDFNNLISPLHDDAPSERQHLQTNNNTTGDKHHVEEANVKGQGQGQNEQDEKSKRTQFIKTIINHSITFNSSFLIVGGLSESYFYGLKMLPNIAAVMIGYMYALLIIYPFMYSLDFKSPYDYLKRRYANRECVKLVCVCLAMFYYFSFASLYLWGCAAIINILVPDVMSIGVANIMLGLYSTSGSVLGGFVQSTRANIVQFLTVFIGILAAMYLTLVDQQVILSNSASEALVQVWELAKVHDRTSLYDSHVDLTTRYTLLNQLISLPLPWCSKLGIFLPNYVRTKSTDTKTKARLLFVSKIPLTIIFNAILVVAGALFCFIYFYADCDPLHSRRMHNKNQVGVLWLHSVLAERAHVPALSGVVFASIVYFALIQHSISMSTIGRMLFDEIFDPFLFSRCRRLRCGFRQKFRKCIPIVIGLASIPFAALFRYSKNTMLSLFFVFNNSMNSPILGLFLLSMFNPYANHVGATSAFLINVAINFWMAIGSLAFSNLRNQELDTRTVFCDHNGVPINLTFDEHHNFIGGTNSNSTNMMTNMTLSYNISSSSHGFFLNKQHLESEKPYPSNPFLYYMYSVAPIWYCLFSVLFNLVFGSLFSLAYALIRSRGRSIDLDREFRDERRKYLFFYRLKHFF